jgi:FkbM family methyltransferase
MSTNYFILTKDIKQRCDNNESNDFIYLNGSKSYLLPEINKDYYKEHGLFESGLMEWCKQLCSKDKIFLDIGAHTGTYTVTLANHCKHVYSFEPQKMTYYALCGSIALSNLNNVTCMNIGLGSHDQVGDVKLKIVSNDGGGSSIHATTNILREEVIKVDKLDNLNMTNIGFIKMDVEENEIYVIKGALETLKNSSYPKILFESNFNNEELFGLLKYIGYKIVKLNGMSNMFLAEHV